MSPEVIMLDVLVAALIPLSFWFIKNMERLNAERRQLNLERFEAEERESKKRTETIFEVQHAFETRHRLLAILVWSPYYKYREDEFWEQMLNKAQNADKVLLDIKSNNEVDSMVSMIEHFRKQHQGEKPPESKYVS